MYKQQIISRLGVAWGAAALAACSALNVSSDVADRAGITHCRTYSWADANSTATASTNAAAAAFDNPVNESRLREAVEANLAMKGLTAATDAASADCVVDSAIGSRDAVDNYGHSHWSFGLGVGSGFGSHGFGSVGLGTEPYAHHEGRIAVNLYDAKTHQPLWHAWTDTDVTRLTGNQAAARISAAATALFAKYPQ